MRIGRAAGSMLSADYSEFLKTSSREMVAQLVSLASSYQPALRWLRSVSKKMNLSTDQIRVDPDFMILYPEERFEGDWREQEEKQNSAAIDLANRWQRRPFSELVQTICEWEKQADEFGRVWPRRIFVFCDRLSQLVTPTEKELTLAIETLPPVASRPFFETALTSDRLTDAQLKACLRREDFVGVLIEFTLKGRTPNLYKDLESQLPRWLGLIEGMCLRSEVTEDMLQKLLRHDDQQVRFEMALYMFRSKSKHTIPKSLTSLWRATIVQGLVVVTQTNQGELPYDLRELLVSDPTIGPEVLDQLISSGSQLHGYFTRGMIPLMVHPLEKSEKRKLLHRCKHLVYSSLPAILVGADADLYRELLGIPELKHFHVAPLSGDPNEGNWVALAKLALAAGFSHRDVAHAVESSSFSWTGGLSTYYQGWVERFERLRQHQDPDVQKIANEGLKSFIALRDLERKAERLEEIEGMD